MLYLPRITFLAGPTANGTSSIAGLPPMLQALPLMLSRLPHCTWLNGPNWWHTNKLSRNNRYLVSLTCIQASSRTLRGSDPAAGFPTTTFLRTSNITPSYPYKQQTLLPILQSMNHFQCSPGNASLLLLEMYPPTLPTSFAEALRGSPPRSLLQSPQIYNRFKVLLQNEPFSVEELIRRVAMTNKEPSSSSTRSGSTWWGSGHVWTIHGELGYSLSSVRKSLVSPPFVVTNWSLLELKASMSLSGYSPPTLFVIYHSQYHFYWQGC